MRGFKRNLASNIASLWLLLLAVSLPYTFFLPFQLDPLIAHGAIFSSIVLAMSLTYFRIRHVSKELANNRHMAHLLLINPGPLVVIVLFAMFIGTIYASCAVYAVQHSEHHRAVSETVEIASKNCRHEKLKYLCFVQIDQSKFWRGDSIVFKPQSYGHASLVNSGIATLSYKIGPTGTLLIAYKDSGTSFVFEH